MTIDEPDVGQPARRIPADPPPGLPIHSPRRKPRLLRHRFRRWLVALRPKLWTWLTGNTNARRGNPTLVALYVVAIVVAALVALYMSMGEGNPSPTDGY